MTPLGNKRRTHPMPFKPAVALTSEKKKIFIVDDHAIMRQGIAQFIDRESDIVCSGCSGDAQSALKAIKKDVPDFVIVDIKLKGTSGLDLISTLLSLYPQLLILVISMYDESLYLERVLKAGARGYLMKEETSIKLITAIRKILSGDVYMSDLMRESFVNKAITRGKSLTGASPRHLSNRELEVLQLVGQGLSTKKISESLHVSVKTVDSHYANIKTKLHLINSHALIQYAVKWTLMV